MITEEELGAALAGDGQPDEEERFPCPDCDRTYANKGALYNHRRNAHKYGPGPLKGRHGPARQRAAGTRQRSTKASAEPNPDEEVATAVANTQGLFSLVYVVAPHLGVAIAGYTDEQGNEIVKSRAVMAGELLLPLARRDARVLMWLVRYNRLWMGSNALELVTSVGAAAYVDASATSALVASGGDPGAAMAAAQQAAEAGVKLGPMQFQPVKMAIPDVLAFVQSQQAQQVAQHQEASRNGRAPRKSKSKVEVVEGGVTST